MKAIIALLFLLVLMQDKVFAADTISNRMNISMCEGRGCFVIAERIPCLETQQVQGLRVKSGSFVVTVPPNVTWIGLSSNVAVFRYDTSPPIVISTETLDTFQLTNNDITLGQAFDIVFTKTPEDLIDLDKSIKITFMKLMLVKRGLMEKSDKPLIYHKDRMTIYYIPNAGKPYKNVAWIIDSIHHNSALRIETDMDEIIFKSLIFSIKTDGS